MKQQSLIRAFLFTALAIGLVACQGTPVEEPAPPEVQVIVVTATDEPVAEPEAEESSEQGIFVTMIQDLNMRAGDSTSHDIMTVVPGGSSVEVLGKNSSGTWYQISYHDAIGWVSASYTQGDVPADLPIVQAPSASGGSGSSGGGGGSGGSTASTPTSAATGGGGGDTGSGGDTGGGGGSQPTAPSDSDLVIEVNIKNHNSSHNGVISYPDGDTSDRIFINVSGFDSVVTSGDVTFTLACTGEGAGNVLVKKAAGNVGNKSCNTTWTKLFTTDSDNGTITVYLESGPYAYVNWTLIISADN